MRERIGRHRGGMAVGVYGPPAATVKASASALPSIPMPAPHIEVRDLSKRWLTRDGAVLALDGIALTVAPQEFVTVLGPSGCGKSTLLSIIGGLVAPDAGEVRVAGAPLRRPDPRKVAMVFQDPGLFPWRTALENVEF